MQSETQVTSLISPKEMFISTVSLVSLACIEDKLRAPPLIWTHAPDCLIVIPPRDVAWLHATKGAWLRLISAIIPSFSDSVTLTHRRDCGTNWTPISSSLVYTLPYYCYLLHRQSELTVTMTPHFLTDPPTPAVFFTFTVLINPCGWFLDTL